MFFVCKCLFVSNIISPTLFSNNVRVVSRSGQREPDTMRLRQVDSSSIGTLTKISFRTSRILLHSLDDLSVRGN